MSSMSRVATVLAVGAALAFSSLAVAGGLNYTKDGSIAAPEVEGPLTREGKAIPAAQSNAKLALYVKPGFIVRAKNVTSVTLASTGQYCVKPSASAGINLSQIVPVATVEWGTSLVTVSDAMFVYYRASGAGCPAGTLEVMTFDDNAGAPVLSNGIAFTLIVQ